MCLLVGGNPTFVDTTKQWARLCSLAPLIVPTSSELLRPGSKCPARATRAIVGHPGSKPGCSIMSVCPRAMVEGVRSRRSAVGCSEGPPLLRENKRM